MSSASHAIVLGAGMVGVSAALQLQMRGWKVVLVDRKGVGQETSFGNAGIIQSEAVEPYAMPRDFASLLAIALGTTNKVHYAPIALPQHVSALVQYWWNSAPKRYRRIATSYSRIIAAATAEHQKLIEQTTVDHLIRRDGFRVLLRSQAAMDTTLATAERLAAEYGVTFKALSPAELGKAEPALIDTGVGAIHWLAPWTVRDPGGLAAAYGDLFVRLGGTFAAGDADSLAQTPAGGWRVTTDGGPLEAEHVVVALGPWSPQLLQRFGYRFPMVRKRGYHMHYRAPKALDLPLMDDAFGYVMAPMVSGVRITTGADLIGDEPPLMPAQLREAEKAARTLLDLGAPVENRPWVGTRPCMPDMLPVVGAAVRHKGLWLHFGHGHQGFTLGPATGRLLAELMSGEAPFVDGSAMNPGRFH
jgi:D-amino-acid dehydrogenase